MVTKPMPVKTVKRIKAEQRAFMRQVAFDATHKNVICALKTAGFLCEHNDMSMSEYDRQCCPTFLVKLHTALIILMSNPKTADIGILDFLPNQSMVRSFEKMKIRKMSKFLDAPLSFMVSELDCADMKLPAYIQYLHPEFNPPTKKECRRLHKARK